LKSTNPITSSSLPRVHLYPACISTPRFTLPPSSLCKCLSVAAKSVGLNLEGEQVRGLNRLCINYVYCTILPQYYIPSATTSLQFQDVVRLFSWVRVTCNVTCTDNDICIRSPLNSALPISVHQHNMAWKCMGCWVRGCLNACIRTGARSFRWLAGAVRDSFVSNFLTDSTCSLQDSWRTKDQLLYRLRGRSFLCGTRLILVWYLPEDHEAAWTSRLILEFEACYSVAWLIADTTRFGKVVYSM